VRHRYGELDLDLLRSLVAAEKLLELFRELLLRTGGDVSEALEWMKQLQRRGAIPEDVDLDALLEQLETRGFLGRGEDGRFELASGGERMLRRSALEEVFRGLRKGGVGDHPVPRTGAGSERLPETRPWCFGDPLDSIDARKSFENALRRAGAPGAGEAVRFDEEDLEVSETELLSSCATVIAIDISHSMVLYGEDRFTPAKKVSLALVELIRRKYRKDSIDVVLFGDEATVVPVAKLSQAQPGPFHTNTKAGLELAAALLRRRRHANRQLFLVTDGKPSCITENGRLYKNPFGLDLRIVNRTLEAAEQCRRDGIELTTFMVATDPTLVDFVETMTRIARGRAFLASPDSLAEVVLADFVRNRRRRVR
jgi:Ca-activated chloride channel homolog